MRQLLSIVMLSALLWGEELSQVIEERANSFINKVSEDDVVASLIATQQGWGVSAELPYLQGVTGVEAMPLVVNISANTGLFGFDIGVRKYHKNSYFGLFYGGGLQSFVTTQYLLAPHANVGFRALIDKDIYLDASYHLGYDVTFSGSYGYNIYTNVTTAISYRF
jgi:hypothetical protein